MPRFLSPHSADFLGLALPSSRFPWQLSEVKVVPVWHNFTMCGRYRLSRRKQILEEHFDTVSGEEDWTPRYNIAPTQPVPLIRQRKEYELRAPIHNVQVVVPEKNGHRSLAAAVETYLEEIKLTKKPKTHSSYSVALSYFMESCHKPNLEDIERLD